MLSHAFRTARYPTRSTAHRRCASLRGGRMVTAALRSGLLAAPSGHRGGIPRRPRLAATATWAAPTAGRSADHGARHVGAEQAPPLSPLNAPPRVRPSGSADQGGAVLCAGGPSRSTKCAWAWGRGGRVAPRGASPNDRSAARNRNHGGQDDETGQRVHGSGIASPTRRSPGCCGSTIGRGM